LLLKAALLVLDVLLVVRPLLLKAAYLHYSFSGSLSVP
jgi:hypothetical protein